MPSSGTQDYPTLSVLEGGAQSRAKCSFSTAGPWREELQERRQEEGKGTQGEEDEEEAVTAEVVEGPLVSHHPLLSRTLP